MQKISRQVLVISSLIELADIIFKYFAITRLPESGRVVFPIDFILHKNPGIAFDIKIPLILIILLTGFIVLALVYLAKKEFTACQPRAIGAIVIIIGALGNAFDRILNGFTTDYIILFGRSVINLSDILIISGTLFLLWYNKEKETV